MFLANCLRGIPGAYRIGSLWTSGNCRACVCVYVCFRVYLMSLCVHVFLSVRVCICVSAVRISMLAFVCVYSMCTCVCVSVFRAQLILCWRLFLYLFARWCFKPCMPLRVDQLFSIIFIYIIHIFFVFTAFTNVS